MDLSSFIPFSSLVLGLDDTALALHGTFVLHDTDGNEERTAIETFLDREDQRLLLNNHVLVGLDKQQFIAAAPQHVYEARVIPEEGGLVEVDFIAHPAPSNGKFLREGLRRTGPRSVLLAFKSFKPNADDETAATPYPE
jgi:hypothetical protein